MRPPQFIVADNHDIDCSMLQYRSDHTTVQQQQKPALLTDDYEAAAITKLRPLATTNCCSPRLSGHK